MNKKLGVLLHVSSLKSEYGIGDFGKSAYEFIDFLSENKIDVWQILPLSSTNIYNCPYSSLCYFSFDTMYVSPEDLLKRNLIMESDLLALKKLKKSSKVEYSKVKAEKLKLLNIAYKNITEGMLETIKLLYNNDAKIRKYAEYLVLVDKYGEDWRKFPFSANDENSKEYKDFCNDNYDRILKYVFFQYILNEEWQDVLKYANIRGVEIYGDLPVYSNINAFEVYQKPNIYLLDKNKFPKVYGGMPPDSMCPKGQNWGTCVYNWKLMSKDNYAFLVDKIKTVFKFYNVLRIDHFIGYVKHFEVDAKNNDPALGKWTKSGGKEFFEQLFNELDATKIIVEDLGAIIPEVENTRDKFNLTGMSVLQDYKNSNYLPNNVKENTIYYLGTHDNNTFVGFLNSLNKQEKTEFLTLLNIRTKNNKKICLECINKMMESKGGTVILQMQDFLLQDEKFRMNVPGRAEDCWEYKVPNNYKKKFIKTLSKIRR